MANVNVILDAASVQIVDTASTVNPNAYRVNSPIGEITLAATKAAYESYFNVAGGAGTSLSLPAATIWFLYVKNLDAVANLTIQFQAAGGSLNSSANSEILTPGGVKIYANASEGAGGISAITLISSVGNTAAEILLAA